MRETADWWVEGDQHQGAAEDPEEALVAFGRAFATEVARSPQRSALLRLMIAEAAEFLGVLVTGRVHNHSWYGTVAPDDAEIERLATGGVEVFLKAYRPR
nr:hypothetical protein GCM10020063_034880 [Dactylosporangium thailandense]